MERSDAGTHVDGDELEDAVLRQDADDGLLARLVVAVDERKSASVRADERGAGVRERLVRVDRDGRRRGNVDGLLDLCAQRARGPSA